MAVSLPCCPELAFYQLIGHGSELTETSGALHHLRWGWVLPTAAAEAGSFLAFALLERKMLRTGGASVAIGPVAAITLAANAIANSVPAGAAIAPVYTFRQFRHRGSGPAIAGRSVAATFVAESVTLTAVAAAGAAVAGAEGAGLDLIGVIVTVLGQLAANLPVAPGGLGVVEGSLTIAIVAYGGAAPSTVVAVLLYRVLSFWPRPASAISDSGRPGSPSTAGSGADCAALSHPDDRGEILQAAPG